MRTVCWLLGALALGALSFNGCGSCAKKPAAQDAGKVVAKPEPKPDPKPEPKPEPAEDPEPEVAKKDDGLQKVDHNYVEGQQVVSDGKPMGIQRMPSVTKKDLEDPRLNDKLPIGSKKTLKILEKLSKKNPNLFPTKVDPKYTPPSDKGSGK